MLHFYRKNIKAIVWIIVLSFVVWGAGTFTLSRQSTASYAGSIFGKKVTNKEFLTTFRFYELLSRSQASQKSASEKKEGSAAEATPKDQQDSKQKIKETGDASVKETAGNLPQPATSAAAEPKSPKNATAESPEPSSFDQIRLAAWQALILDRIGQQEKIQVTDAELVNEVEGFFSDRGFFDRNAYESWVERTFRGRPRDFEEVVRKHLRAQKFKNQFLAALPEKDRENQWRTKWTSIVMQAKLEDFTEQKEPSTGG